MDKTIKKHIDTISQFGSKVAKNYLLHILIAIALIINVTMLYDLSNSLKKINRNIDYLATDVSHLESRVDRANDSLHELSENMRIEFNELHRR